MTQDTKDLLKYGIVGSVLVRMIRTWLEEEPKEAPKPTLQTEAEAR